MYLRHLLMHTDPSLCWDSGSLCSPNRPELTVQSQLVTNSGQSPCLRLLSAGFVGLTLSWRCPHLPGGELLCLATSPLGTLLCCVSHQSPVSSATCFSGTGWGPGLEEQLVFPGLWGVSLELFLLLANWGYLNVSVSLHHEPFSSLSHWMTTNFKGSSSTHEIRCLRHITYPSCCRKPNASVPDPHATSHPSLYRIVEGIGCVPSLL